MTTPSGIEFHEEELEPAPISYGNWCNFDAGVELSSIVEAGIFTDATIYGEYSVGPLKFLNTIAHAGLSANSAKEAIVVRVNCHWPRQRYRPASKTEDSHYHGGDHLDEIASLVSLLLGIKAQAGPISRDFNSDPLGTPRRLEEKSVPMLFPVTRSRLLVSGREANLTSLGDLNTFSKMSPQSASDLVKAARLYQQARWVAESQPELAWLLFVSALEVAAQSWAKTSIGSQKPILPTEIDEIVRASGDEPLIAAVAEYFAEQTGATKKFLNFVLSFLPNPSERRTERENLQLKFDSPELLTRALRQIYRYRSRALHSGVAFPKPMCMAPHFDPPEEVFFALGMSANNASWKLKDVPMLLHTFEHITRGALLKWMRTLAVDTERFEALTPP